MDIQKSIVAILDKKKKIIGTGFVVGENLILTCAHVVERATSHIVDQTTTDLKVEVTVRFAIDGSELVAQVDAQSCSPSYERDVALLRVGTLPQGVNLLPLAPAAGSEGHDFYAYGYATVIKVQGIGARGRIVDIVNNGNLLQLTSQEPDHGMSGGPVLDEQRRVVIGMVTKGKGAIGEDKSLRNIYTTFATSINVIFEVCHELKPSEMCPYRSLDAFTEQDAPFFFGRERVITKLLESLKREPRFLAVLGPSGSGKSSVVQAGLIPALRHGKIPGSQKWDIVTIRPANQPFGQLEGAGFVNTQDGLENAVRTWLTDHPDITRLVLVIDQFEEVLVSTPANIRQKFITELAQLLDAPVTITVILTLRDDFYSRFLHDVATLAGWLERGLVNTPPVLEQVDLMEMIVEPAKSIGLSFDEGLVNVIIADACETDRTKGLARSTILPLLEFALTQLWEMRKDGRLTHEAYKKIGGTTGSLSQWADRIYYELSPVERKSAEAIFCSLVHLGDEKQQIPDVRMMIQIDGVDIFQQKEITQSVIGKLVNARLLSVHSKYDSGQQFVEIIHDALLLEWALLGEWIEKYRHREQIGRERRRRLIILGLSVGLIVMIALAIFALIQRNSAVIERDNANHQARISRSGQLAALSQTLNDNYPERSLLLAIEAIKVTSDAGEQRIPQAEQAVRDALYGLSGSGISGHETAVLVTAFNPDSRWLATGSVDGTVNLHDLKNQNALNRPITFYGHRDGVTALAFSPDSHWLATGGGTESTDLFREGGSVNSASLTLLAARRRGDEIAVRPLDTKIRIWTLDNPDPMQTPILLSGHTEQISALAFSSDGRWFASSSYDGTIQLWDVKKDPNFKNKPLVLKGHQQNIVSIIFSKDGHWLVSASLDQTARLWDLTSADPNTYVIQLLGHKGAIQAIALSPDGRWLATSSMDFTVRLWDIKAADPNRGAIVLEGHQKNILGLAFSPDSHWLASGSVDSTIRLWDLTKLETINNSIILKGPENFIFSALVFNPNSRLLFAGGGYIEHKGKNEGIFLWDLTSDVSQNNHQLIKAHDDFIKQIVISSDGNWLISSSWNGSSRLWNMDSLERSLPDNPVTASPFILPLIPGAIAKNVISPDGNWLASVAGNSNTVPGQNDVYLWHLNKIDIYIPKQSSLSPIKLMGHTASVFTVAFSPDNQWVASASYDRTVRVWNITSPDFPNQSLVLKHTGQPTGIVFSPDNHWLATASDGKTIYLWDMNTTDPSLNKISLVSDDEDINSTTIIFSSDGHWLAAGTYSGAMYIWSIPAADQAKPFITLRGHTDQITKILFLGKSIEKLISVSADTTARLWTIDGGNDAASSVIFKGHTGPILDMDISNDKHWLITGSTDFTARLWDLSTEDPENHSTILPGHNQWVFTTVFTHNSKWLATGSINGITKLWDLSSPNPERTGIILPGDYRTLSMAFSPDDNWLVSSTSTGELYTNFGNIRNQVTSVKLWNMDLKNLVSLACQVLGRNLSYTEWQEYFPGEEYSLTCDSNPIQPSVITAADQLIFRGEIEKARLLLNRAQKIDPSMDLNIETEILRFRVYGLLREGRDLAQLGDTQGASAKFDEAAKLDPSLNIISSERAAQINEAAIDQQVGIYVNQGNFKDAVQYLSNVEQNQAEYLDLSFYWNYICWYGSLNNQVKNVMVACEKAVSLDPKNVSYRDSRGLSRALTGDKAGAIDDFRYYVEWVDGSDALLRKKWILDLQNGINPFDPKTLSELKDGTYTKPDSPLKIQTFNTGEKWTVEVVNMPDDLKVEFPAFLQCRQNKDSDQLTEEYVGVIAIKTLREKAWADTGFAEIVLESATGEVVSQNNSFFEFGANGSGWFMSNVNAQGRTMESSGGSVSKIKIKFNYVTWRPATVDNSQFQLDVKIDNHSYLANGKYPQSQFSIRVNNTGAKTLNDLELFGVLLDTDGKLVDILKMNSGTNDQLPKTSVNYVLSSLSQTGRCVGSKSSHPMFHYWVTFKADDGQRVTYFYSKDLP